MFLEQLEHNPAQFLPEVEPAQLSGDVVSVDLNKGMAHTLSVLTKHPVKTRVNLSGTLIVARDSAHAKLKERLDRGEGLPEYFKQFPVYYAGPAKTPTGMASGSFGPTTAGRMDSYVDLFQANGGSMVMPGTAPSPTSFRSPSGAPPFQPSTRITKPAFGSF